MILAHEIGEHSIEIICSFNLLNNLTLNNHLRYKFRFVGPMSSFYFKAGNFRQREAKEIFFRFFIFPENLNMEKRKSERYSVDPDSTLRDIYQVCARILLTGVFLKKVGR